MLLRAYMLCTVISRSSTNKESYFDQDKKEILSVMFSLFMLYFVDSGDKEFWCHSECCCGSIKVATGLKLNVQTCYLRNRYNL